MAGELTWDGSSETGEPVPEGTYAYAVKGILVSTHRAGRRTIRLPIGKTEVFKGEITVETDLPPPEIVLVSPIEGTITTSVTVTVAGSVTGEEPLTVAVSGVPVNLVDGAFSTDVTLDEEGPRLIEVVATDALNQTTTLTRTVIQDSVNPTLTIVAPTSGAILVTATPTFELAFDDSPGSGIDPASFRASVAGLDRTADFSVEEGGANGTLSASLEDGLGLVASFSVSDRAGHTTTASVTFTVDTQSPVLTLDPPDGSIVTVSQPVLKLTFDDGPLGSGADLASLILRLDGLDLTDQATIDGTRARIEIEDPLDESEHLFEASLADQAGNVTTKTSTFRVDTLVPVVLVTAPAPESVIAEPRPTVTIAYDDAGSGVVPSTLAVSVDGTEITTQFVPGPTGAVGTLPAGVELADGEHQVLASVTDIGGLTGFGLGPFTVDTTAPVFASIHPPAGSVLGSTPVRISGVILDLTPVEVEVNGIPAVVSGSGFTLDALELPEGPSLIELTAVDRAGNLTSRTHTLVIDTQAPAVTLVTPSPGVAFQNRSVDLVFEVADQTTTTLVVQGGGVSVSRVITPGSVAVTIPIELPADTTTTYTVHATDAAGNLSVVQTVELSHDGTPPAPPILFTRSIVTSNTRVGIDGCAEPGSIVEFLGGLGTTQTIAEEPMGKFSLEFDLPPDTTLTVRVRVIDAAGNASATDEVKITQYTGRPPAPVSSVVAVGGFAQQGLVGEALHQPLTVLVRSLDGLPLAGQDVLFRVMAGRMTLNGPAVTLVTVRTDAAGRARVTGVLAEDASDGDEPGDALVVATRPGPAGIPAVFDIAALPDRPDHPTQLSGYLEDSQGRAIPGVDVHLHTPPFLTTVTDQRGHFRFEDIPPGEHHFLLDGSTADLPGTYTNLVFALQCLPGQDNSLGMPIFLPQVDVTSGIEVSETEGGVLTNPKLPGLEIQVAPGSATFPGGSKSGRLAVVAVPQDKTPMPFPEGLYGNFVIAVYPPGTHFDPPARTVFPNLDPRLSPGDKAPIISFDHDVGDYVKVGTATVSPDGSRIISDPGYGIKVAAWHVTPPPDPPEYGCVRGRLTGPPGSCIVESECWTVNNRRLVNPVLGDLPPGGVRVEICNVPEDELAGAKLECRADSMTVNGPEVIMLQPPGSGDGSTAEVTYVIGATKTEFLDVRFAYDTTQLAVEPEIISSGGGSRTYRLTVTAIGDQGTHFITIVSSTGVACRRIRVHVPGIEIVDIVRLIAPGNEVSILGGGELLSSDLGFKVIFNNYTESPFDGEMRTNPASNLDMVGGAAPPILAITTSSILMQTTGDPVPQATVTQDQAARDRVLRFTVPAGIAVPLTFQFNRQTRLNFPSGTFEVEILQGFPQTRIVLSRVIGLVSNARLDLEVVPQFVPGLASPVDTVIDKANNYSENTLVRITPRIRVTAGEVQEGQLIEGFAGSIRVDDLSKPLRTAYEVVGDDLPRGRKGFFALRGSGIEERVVKKTFTFSDSGSDQAGTQLVMLESMREYDPNDPMDVIPIDTKAQVRAIFGSAEDPDYKDGLSAGQNNPIEVEQWVDLIGRTRAGRTAGINGIRDWLEEHVWDILTRDAAAFPRPPGRADERNDVVDTVGAIKESLALPPGERGKFQVAVTERLPGYHDMPNVVRSTVTHFVLHPLLRADRLDPSKPDVLHFFSNVTLHEARHAWQNFQTRIRIGDPTITGGVLTSADLDDAETNLPIYQALELRSPPSYHLNLPDNDDDSLVEFPAFPGELHFQSAFNASVDQSRGDLLPERLFVRTRGVVGGVPGFYIDLDATRTRRYADPGGLTDDDTPDVESILGTPLSSPTIDLWVRPDNHPKSSPEQIRQFDAIEFGNRYQTEE